MIIPKSDRTLKFTDEVDELRAIFSHMLRASRVQIAENNLDNLQSIREEDGTSEIVDPQDSLGSLVLEVLDSIILTLLRVPTDHDAFGILLYTLSSKDGVITGVIVVSLSGTSLVEVILIKGHLFPTTVKILPVALPVIVVPLRIELPFLEDQFQEDPPPEVPMANNRTMAELLQAPTVGYEDAIVIPEITANNFELKNVNDQDSLNSAAGGNFLDKMPRECLKNIESKSKVRQSRAKAVVAKVSTSSSTSAISFEVVELKDLVRALLLDKKNQSSALVSSPTPAPVKAVEPNCVTCGGGNFNQGQLHRPQVNQPPAYQAPIPQTQRVSQTDFESYVKANDAILRNMQSQGQSTQNQCQNIQNQYQNLQIQMANLTDMMSKLVSSNTASSSGAGTLPSNTITNPKEELNGITTRSGVANQGPTIPTPSKQGTEVTKDQVKLLAHKVLHPSNLWLFNLKLKLRFLSPLLLPFTDALILMPKFASTLKALIGNKEKLNEMARTPMNEHCSAVILNKLPRKLEDHGKFLIPCEFPGMDECLALADLGASINLMPLSAWEALSLSELTPTCMTLELTDRSVSKPIGIAKDVSLKLVCSIS
nr:reverse transcriptase domain-containing protein [Tanacetum cinerariifolium]